MSNQKPVPPFTGDELKSRVEAVYNASTEVEAAANLVSNIYLYGNNELAGLTGRRWEAARRLHRFIEKHKKDHSFEMMDVVSSVYKARKVLEQVKRFVGLCKPKEQGVVAAANGQVGNSLSWANHGYSVSSSNYDMSEVTATVDVIWEDGCVEDHPDLNVAQ
ncbi:MAG: hypothetical protein SGBAC_004533 [Bacillariaceae sp.]